MAKRYFNDKWPSVIQVDGELWLISAKGELMGSVQAINLGDDVEMKFATAQVKLIVNIGHPDQENLIEKIGNRHEDNQQWKPEDLTER